MTKKTPPEVKVLWGHMTRTMSWIIETPERGRQSIAVASPTAMTVRDLDGIPGMNAVAGQVLWAWEKIRDGVDLADQATHQLKPPHMRDIEPIKEKL